MRRILLLLAVLGLATPVAAQTTTNVTATDTSTGARTQVGDNTNHAIRMSCVSGCSGGTSDVDDGTIASGQTSGISFPLNYVFDGANWKRFTIGTAGTASAQVLTVQGVASMTPVQVSQSTGTNLHIVCDSGCSSSAGFADNSAFTYGTTAINPIGGVLDDVSTNVATENSAAVARITPQKALHINLRNQAGTEIGTSSTPVQVSLANTATNATAVKVDGSGVTQPVSNAGTFAVQAALQAGTAYVGKVANWADGTLASGVTAAMTGTTSTSVIGGTASNYVYVGSCSINNTHASVDTLVNLQDGSGGTTLWTFVALHGYGGESHTFNPPLKVPTSGNGLFVADATTGASVIVSCQGFKSTTSF